MKMRKQSRRKKTCFKENTSFKKNVRVIMLTYYWLGYFKKNTGFKKVIKLPYYWLGERCHLHSLLSHNLTSLGRSNSYFKIIYLIKLINNRHQEQPAPIEQTGSKSLYMCNHNYNCKGQDNVTTSSIVRTGSINIIFEGRHHL